MCDTQKSNSDPKGATDEVKNDVKTLWFVEGTATLESFHAILKDSCGDIVAMYIAKTDHICAWQELFEMLDKMPHKQNTTFFNWMKRCTFCEQYTRVPDVYEDAELVNILDFLFIIRKEYICGSTPEGGVEKSLLPLNNSEELINLYDVAVRVRKMYHSVTREAMAEFIMELYEAETRITELHKRAEKFFTKRKHTAPKRSRVASD